MWFKCPQSWYLNYAKGMRKTDLNMSIFFGTAMHHAIQSFIETLYTKGVTEAASLDVYQIFKDKLYAELEKEKEKYTAKPEEIEELNKHAQSNSLKKKYLAVDLIKADQVEKFLNELDTIKQIDCLVNNAGINRLNHIIIIYSILY